MPNALIPRSGKLKVPLIELVNCNNSHPNIKTGIVEIQKILKTDWFRFHIRNMINEYANAHKPAGKE